MGKLTSWHKVVDSDPDTESHEDLPANGGIHLTIKTSDQKATDSQNCRMRPRLSPSKLNGEMRLAESAGRAQDHNIDKSGLPARFAPPRWRNIITVVDNDGRARRTQARLNLALERGELHMACWLQGWQWNGCARCAHGTTGKRTFFPQFLEKLESDLVRDYLRAYTEIQKFHESAIFVNVVRYLTVAARVATAVKHVVW